jgi:hypothetical protein
MVLYVTIFAVGILVILDITNKGEIDFNIRREMIIIRLWPTKVKLETLKFIKMNSNRLVPPVSVH